MDSFYEYENVPQFKASEVLYVFYKVLAQDFGTEDLRLISEAYFKEIPELKAPRGLSGYIRSIYRRQYK